MKILFAYPGTGIFGQQAALAFAERDALEAYLTTFAWRQDGPLARLLRALPGGAGARIERELARRALTAAPEELVETRAFWEVVRTLAAKAGASAPLVDRIWDHLSHEFTRAAARRLERGGDAVYAYEYSALEAFDAAARRGKARILDFPSLNSRQFEEIRQCEKARHPELRDSHDAYFDARFERRQARRDAEMARADVIITNSSVTRASHIAHGADPEKIFAVPLGAPPVRAELPLPDDHRNRPLRVVWAGTFSIRKGAYHFVEAWRRIAARGVARVDIYGAVVMSDRHVNPVPEGMNFRGSVIRSRLFEAFDAADVLVFPTLADGFGMVVTEAFSRGLPVITTSRAGASDLVRDRENGLIIEAGAPEPIVAALEWCLDNRPALAAMRPAALATARGWQWSDYRKALASAVSTGLSRAGFAPDFDRCAPAVT